MIRHLLLIPMLVLPVLVGFGSASNAAPRHHYRYNGYAPVGAVAPPDLYCLQGRIWGYPGNCQFASYEQCSVTASGTDAYCGINPFWAFRGWRQE